MRHTKITLFGGLLVLASACTDRPSPTAIALPDRPSLIINGAPTGTLYSSVGALLVDWQPPAGVITVADLWCTGSLISPTIFLTAAHCVTGSRFTPPGSQFYVTFAPDVAAPGVTFIAATGYTFDVGRNPADARDLAVVNLPASATAGLTPLGLPQLGELDQLAAQGGLRGALFVNVGYGSSASRRGPPIFPVDGKRNMSKSLFMGLQPTWLGLLMNSNATGEGGDCYGDSGGPKFLDGNANKIYSTVSTGDFNCRATSWSWRLDTPQARAFLGRFVALP